VGPCRLAAREQVHFITHLNGPVSYILLRLLQRHELTKCPPHLPCGWCICCSGEHMRAGSYRLVGVDAEIRRTYKQVQP
jgi:hypothetical protein